MTVQRIARLLKSSATATSAVGIFPACQWFLQVAQKNMGVTAPPARNIHPHFLNYPVKLRTQSSDPFVFRQIMIENEYRPLADLPVATILDLGANVGLASAWFLSRFPGAQVLAVEAAADNYKACCENLAPYGSRAHVLHGAAWSRQEMLTLCRKSCAADNWVRQPAHNDTDTTDVMGWDIARLIEMSGFAKIDLLKMDVEGAETEIFHSNVAAWLGRISNLCIELHGQECRHAFFAALSAYDYQHAQSGELDICTNIRLKSGAAYEKLNAGQAEQAFQH